MKAKKRTDTSGAYLVSRDQSDWRRERFEQALASGAVVIRYVCPNCAWGRGEHRDCPHQDRKAA